MQMTRREALGLIVAGAAATLTGCGPEEAFSGDNEGAAASAVGEDEEVGGCEQTEEVKAFRIKMKIEAADPRLSESVLLPAFHGLFASLRGIVNQLLIDQNQKLIVRDDFLKNLKPHLAHALQDHIDGNLEVAFVQKSDHELLDPAEEDIIAILLSDSNANGMRDIVIWFSRQASKPPRHVPEMFCNIVEEPLTPSRLRDRDYFSSLRNVITRRFDGEAGDDFNTKDLVSCDVVSTGHVDTPIYGGWHVKMRTIRNRDRIEDAEVRFLISEHFSSPYEPIGQTSRRTKLDLDIRSIDGFSRSLALKIENNKLDRALETVTPPTGKDGDTIMVLSGAKAAPTDDGALFEFNRRDLQDLATGNTVGAGSELFMNRFQYREDPASTLEDAWLYNDMQDLRK